MTPCTISAPDGSGSVPHNNLGAGNNPLRLCAASRYHLRLFDRHDVEIDHNLFVVAAYHEELDRKSVV